MTVAQYLAALLRRGIDVGLKGDDGLLVDGPEGLVDDELLAYLADNKAVIAEWLKRPVSALQLGDLRAFDFAPHAFGRRSDATPEDESRAGFEVVVDVTELDAEEHAQHVKALDQWLAEVERVRAEKQSTPGAVPPKRSAPAPDSQHRQALLPESGEDDGS